MFLNLKLIISRNQFLVYISSEKLLKTVILAVFVNVSIVTLQLFVSQLSFEKIILLKQLLNEALDFLTKV